MQTKIIVVGSSGYIGRKLLTHSYSGGSIIGTSSGPNTNLKHLDLRFPEGFDYTCLTHGTVLLTAAISAPDICTQEHDRAWEMNVTGTSAFIANAIDCGSRVVFFSSDTVYGEREDVFDETTVCNPVGEYAEMKREVEQRFSGNASFKAIRLSYVFSREDKFSRYLAGCAERKEEAELFHPFYRAIIHRNDVVEGALALATRWNEVPQQVINFGGSELLSRVDFAEALRDAFLTDLRFKVSEPPEEFFESRPRVIAMNSPILAKLLRRPPLTLREAARMEFAISSKI